MTKSRTEAAALLANNTGFLRHYMGKLQRKMLVQALQGEEGEYFAELIHDLAERIRAMPVVYEQDGLGMAAKIHLHYFRGNVDAWITERDPGGPDDSDPGEQSQAFGNITLTGDKRDAKLGYISIQELIDAGVELDLHWTVITLKELK